MAPKKENDESANMNNRKATFVTIIIYLIGILPERYPKAECSLVRQARDDASIEQKNLDPKFFGSSFAGTLNEKGNEYLFRSFWASILK